MNWVREQNETREDYLNGETPQRKTSWKDGLCQGKTFGRLFLFLMALSPILVYYLVVDEGTFTREDLYTCLVNDTFRVPCGRKNFTDKECLQADCCYDTKRMRCYHSVPSRYFYEANGGDFRASHEKTPIGTLSSQKLKISVDEISPDTVRVILHGANETVPTNTLTNKNYTVNVQNRKLQVEVYRNNAEQDRLLTTSNGPLMVSEKYSEWTLYLTNHSLFGLNRTLLTFQENRQVDPVANSTITKVIYNNKNDHYSVPVFWAYANGKFHGVQIKHEGPLEIEILPSYLVVLRSLTGGTIELVLSVGPTPKDLHDQQATSTSVAPFWLMGTHMCRNSENRNTTQVIEQFTMETYADSYCIDENIYMALMIDNLTNVNIINETLTALSEQGKKFLLSVPPQLSVDSGSLYSKAASLDLLYRRTNGTIYTGRYRGATVAYPDFSHSGIHEYLSEFNNFISNYFHINIDGFVLKDNWPIDESYVMKDNSTFPYFTEEMQEAMSYTIPWNATVNNISHILKHNSYGRSQTLAYNDYYNKSDPQTMILSSAKMFGQTQSVTTIQNVDASWDNLGQFIENILFSSITGNHLVSVPVCGDTTAFDAATQEKLCIRWYLVASTMPFLRISSPSPFRDPASLDSNFATSTIEAAMDRRMALLRHYYTILYRRRYVKKIESRIKNQKTLERTPPRLFTQISDVIRNEPLVRPMFYDYYEDTATFPLTDQYMIGDSILVAHALTPNKKVMRVYLPPTVGVWFEMWSGKAHSTNATDSWTDVSVVETDMVMFVKQGAIIPLTWCHINLLKLNLNKCQKITFSRGLDPIDHIYRVNDTNLSVTNTIKDLGVIFDSKMSFKHHVIETSSRARKMLDFFLRSSEELSVNAVEIIYCAQVENEINLIVALNCTVEPYASTGTLLLDDLVSFTADNSSVNIFNMPSLNCNYTLGYIKLYSVGRPSTSYRKNENMCDRGANFTITYEEIPTSTEPMSTESMSTESKSTESKSTESESTESKSTESMSTKSTSTESTSTETSSTVP
ncbi:unnamed protein product [Phaedon cochleariae]|uniref:P-type domain-containing protein n=1 Tax=Phaedon cochleariae TaxID=80249 RepID=A0A9N9S9L7_PHACE|nr:unnamed protein product [Phaedon cochleariae]